VVHLQVVVDEGGLDEAHHFDRHLQRDRDQVVEQDDERQQVVAKVGRRQVCERKTERIATQRKPDVTFSTLFMSSITFF